MGTLNPIEQQIHDYLKRFPIIFVSVTEVSKNVGHRKWFNADRNWARPILRRLEMDGWVESNPFGEYRLTRPSEDATTFRQALGMPGMTLGNTTIICEDDVTETLENSPGTNQHLRKDF
ncbi:MAG: hypothetical protein QOF48_1416 [Verrucomicrobiota bacterium]|jgi:hypothetical protein